MFPLFVVFFSHQPTKSPPTFFTFSDEKNHPQHYFSTNQPTQGTSKVCKVFSWSIPKPCESARFASMMRFLVSFMMVGGGWMEVAQRHHLLQDFQDKHTINKISTWHDIFVEKTCFFLAIVFYGETFLQLWSCRMLDSSTGVVNPNNDSKSSPEVEKSILDIAATKRRKTTTSGCPPKVAIPKMLVV